MSRIGKIPVIIPDNVKVHVDESHFTVEGPKGKMEQEYSPMVSITVEDGKGIVDRQDDSKAAKSMHGLYRNLLNNMVIGVSTGFKKVLLINGVGYRAEIQGDVLVLNLGYSNPIEYPIPDGMSIVCETNNRIEIGGIDKAQVGQIASEIRSLRPPEPYKGKGIRYDNELVRRKVGKSGIK